MELRKSTMQTMKSSKNIDEVQKLMESKFSVEAYTKYSLLNCEGYTATYEKFSFRNANFMIIFMNAIQEENTTYITFHIKERQEGLINFSFGKKESLTNEIKEMLS